MSLNARRLAAVVLAGSALLLPLLAGCSKDEGKALPAPKPAETTTTTEPIDLTSVSLEPIAVTGKETSTTRPLGGGKAAIFGKVVDADGNTVPGAFVRADLLRRPEQARGDRGPRAGGRHLPLRAGPRRAVAGPGLEDARAGHPRGQHVLPRLHRAARSWTSR